MPYFWAGRLAFSALKKGAKMFKPAMAATEAASESRPERLVRKLLAQANDPRTDPVEAAKFRDKANDLIAEHNLDPASFTGAKPAEQARPRATKALPPAARDSVPDRTRPTTPGRSVPDTETRPPDTSEPTAASGGETTHPTDPPGAMESSKPDGPKSDVTQPGTRPGFGSEATPARSQTPASQPDAGAPAGHPGGAASTEPGEPAPHDNDGAAAPHQPDTSGPQTQVATSQGTPRPDAPDGSTAAGSPVGAAPPEQGSGSPGSGSPQQPGRLRQWVQGLRQWITQRSAPSRRGDAGSVSPDAWADLIGKGRDWVRGIRKPAGDNRGERHPSLPATVRPRPEP